MKFKKIIYNSPDNKIKSNFKILKKSDEDCFTEFLKLKYFKNRLENSDYAVSDTFRADLSNQTSGRLDKFRFNIIPWINSIIELKNARILEIGCGTGASTVALAEQGAKVVGVDLDEDSIIVARKRLSVYNLQADFVNINATKIDMYFEKEKFDSIIFFATLEHMTYKERVDSLRAASKLLKENSYLFIIETPNRLWNYDFHTSYLPFYFWLPDEIAYDYSKFSNRIGFNNQYNDLNHNFLIDFQRRGRGVSYHEFEIALDLKNDFEVVSSLDDFRIKKCFRYIYNRFRPRGYFKHKSALLEIGPKLHSGFFEPWLDLAIRKKTSLS